MKIVNIITPRVYRFCADFISTLFFIVYNSCRHLIFYIIFIAIGIIRIIKSNKC